jgi:hypothetical protein
MFLHWKPSESEVISEIAESRVKLSPELPVRSLPADVGDSAIQVYRRGSLPFLESGDAGFSEAADPHVLSSASSLAVPGRFRAEV